MDDPVDATQKQINDAAKELDPSVSGAGTLPQSEPPASPPSSANPPPALKEEALLAPPSEFPPLQELKTTTFGTPTPPPDDTPKPEPPSPTEPSSPAQPSQPVAPKKSVNKWVVLGVLFLLVATLPIAVYYTQQRKQIAEIRSRAQCYQCGGGTCPDGWSYGGDDCSWQDCGSRAAEACQGHQGGGGAPPAAPPPAQPPPSGGGCTPGSCTYYSCNQQLIYNSTCGRSTAPGFCSTNYPSSDPCKRGTGGGGAPPPAAPPPAQPPPSGGGGGTRTVSTGGIPVGQDSGCCSGTPQCQQWFGPSSTCTNLNGACSTGVQCKGGGCGETCGNKSCGTVICAGTQYQQTCNALCPHRCGDLVCNADETAQGCPSDCKVISTGTSTTTGGTTCQAGKIICRKDNPSICPNTHNYSNPSIDATVGISCNGTLADPSKCNFFDACGVPLIEGDTCAGKVRTSTGEPSHGGFVGCSGIKNCFCGDASKPVRGTYTASDGVVRCYDDAPPPGGSLPDSCGAGVRPAVVVATTTTPSGCKSDWCTSESECTSKGGQMGTPQSFANCSPGLVACCLPSGGTTVEAAPTPIPTTPPAGQCTRIKVYKGTVAVDPKTLVAGDSVKLAVAGTNATKGRIRVNGAAFTETTTKNASGEFTVPFTVPSGITNFTVEAEVFTGGQWK